MPKQTLAKKKVMKKILNNIRKAVYMMPLLVASRVSAGPSLDFPANFADFSTADIKTTIENIVRIVIGFLGIITVLIILYGGLIWMTSFGNEEKIEQAKKLIGAGVVGLVIVLASYALANFVVRSLSTAL